MESLWRQKAEAMEPVSNHPVMKSQHREVIVIGAGMAGLLTAYYLKQMGKEVLVLEADRIASGQTEKTTAKITSQHGLKYKRLIRTVGRKKARLYAEANEAAIREYEDLIINQKIDCDFKRVPAYLYTLYDKYALKKEADAAADLGINVFYTKDTELPFSVKAAICFRNQAQFSPLKFVRHIASDLEILEHTKVHKIKGHQVITENQVFTADKMIVATHYPLQNVPGFYFLRQHQERSYVLALSGCRKIKGMYYSIDKGGLSFRQAGDYLLFGGGSHRTGSHKKGGIYDWLFKEAERCFPDFKAEYFWSAQDCMPHDGIPFIGKYSVFTPDLYVATGFQKWGMTSSMIAAMILRDEICGIKNPYAVVFRPQRVCFSAGIGSLILDLGVSAKGLLCGWLGSKSRRCAHLGCELKWNPDEKSWDCPCHGSRFSEKGRLLDNPSKTDIER